MKTEISNAPATHEKTVIKRIIVPTDFSEYSDCAVKIAGIIAQKTGAEVHLVHIIYSPANWVGIPLQEEFLYKETKSLRGKVLAMLDDYSRLEDLKDIKTVDSHIYVNEDKKDILTHADNLNADLIVLGAHGNNKMGELLAGSITRKIVRLAKCPVITAPGKLTKFDLKNIVITSDFSDKSLKSYHSILEIASLFESQVSLVWVDTNLSEDEDDPEMYVENIKEAIQHYYKGISRLDVLQNDKIEETILQYAKDNNADLIAMATHGRKGLSRLIMGSLSENLVNRSPIPVMVTHLS